MNSDRLHISHTYEPDPPAQQAPLAAHDSIGDTFIGACPRLNVGDVIVPDTGTMPENPSLPTAI